MANCTFCNRPTRPGHTCPQRRHQDTLANGLMMLLPMLFLFYTFIFSFKACYRERINQPTPQVLMK